MQPERPRLLTACALIGLAGLMPAAAIQPAAAEPDAAGDAIRSTELPPSERPPQPAEAGKTAGKPDAEGKAPTVDEIRIKMRELENELNRARRELQQKVNERKEVKPEPVEHRLDTIVLPDNPSREDCQAYLGKLRKAAEQKRSFASTDPLVEKLKAVPDEHFDLLVAEIANRSKLRYFVNHVMRESDPEALRERFVATIGQSESSIGIIVMNGWCQDIRPVIVRRIQAADGSLKPAWFQAAVELGDPALYPKLHEITIQSRYATQFINMLRSLPDYDLPHTVNACWKRASEGKLSVSTTNLALLAAEFGNADALGSLIGQLRYTSSYMISSSSYNSRRMNALRFIDFRGSNTEVQAWYQKHKRELVFDHLRKRFVVSQAF